jgi:nucleoside 2-deoxyribosyltransferase
MEKKTYNNVTFEYIFWKKVFLIGKNLYDAISNIKNQIPKCGIIIGDLSFNNPNVFYEVGYAEALNKKLILITPDREKTPFDLKQYNNIELNLQNKEKFKIELKNSILNIYKNLED